MCQSKMCALTFKSGSSPTAPGTFEPFSCASPYLRRQGKSKKAKGRMKKLAWSFSSIPESLRQTSFLASVKNAMS